jgi:acetyl-CoA acetyltransferase
VIAGGVESMSRAPFVMGKADSAFSRAAKIEDTTIGWRFVNPAMQKAYGVDSMPETAENVAAEHGVSRADQDAFALRSQQRAAAAIKAGFFDGEITPVEIPARPVRRSSTATSIRARRPWRRWPSSSPWSARAAR